MVTHTLDSLAVDQREEHTMSYTLGECSTFLASGSSPPSVKLKHIAVSTVPVTKYKIGPLGRLAPLANHTKYYYM